jgi:tetratricopeptide (TPR) repeat protein
MLDKQQIGPYATCREIGRGGMGVVYEAEDARGHRVAVKVARATGSTLASIRTEIRALRRLKHPGVVRILDHGVDAGEPWYAMEYLEGSSWQDLNREIWPRAGAPAESTLDLGDLDDSGPLGETDGGASPTNPVAAGEQRAGNGRLEQILRLARRVCDPLGFLHGAGIVHRDVKPANIHLRANGQPVLVDLGLATRVGRRNRESLDAGGRPAGTLQYSAPEQVLGLQVDARADLYALGAILYESVTGCPAVTGASRQALREAVLQAPPPVPSSLVAGVPPALDELLVNLLAKDPRDRLGYASDVAKVLADLLGESVGGDEERAYLYRPRVVGREAIVQQLVPRLAETLLGRGSIVLVGGESGVGKTALAAEITRQGTARHLTVIAGECAPTLLSDDTHAESAGAPLQPLLPLLQHIADTCRAAGSTLSDTVVEDNAPVLATFEPAFSGLPSRRPAPPLLPLLGELARRRALEAVVGTVARFVEHCGAVLLVIDDIQWADDLTLSFLSALTPEWLASKRLFVLGTYRVEEVGPPLRALLGQPAVSCLELTRLDEPAVSRMVSDMLALTTAPPEFVRFLHEQSEGNPFFVAEYLRVAVQEQVLLRAGGRWRLPENSFTNLPQPGSLRSLVAQRLAALSARARSVLEVAAVFGRESDPELLQLVAGLSEDDLHEALRELEDRYVLEALDSGLTRFVHDKLRESTYASLAPERARRLHRGAAEVLEARVGGGTPSWALLAHHWRGAEVWDKAVDRLERAIEQDLGQFSNASALHHLATLRTVAEKLPAGSEQVQVGRWERFEADALFGQGDFTRARQHAEAALAAFGTPMPTNTAGLVLSLLGQGARLALGRLFPRLGAPHRPEERRTRQESLGVYAGLMDYFIYENDVLRGIYSGVRVAAMGLPLGPSRPLARALGLLCNVLLTTPLKAVGKDWRTRALAMAESLGDPMTQAYCDIRIAATFVFVADWAAYEPLIERGRNVARAARDDKRLEEADIVRAYERYIRGAFGESLTFADAVEQSARRRGDQQNLSFARAGRGQALLRIGRVQDALVAIEPALPRLEREGTLAERVLVWGVLALVHLEDGDRARAAKVATRAHAELKAGPLVLWFFEPAMSALAEVWLRLAESPMPGSETSAPAMLRELLRLFRDFSGRFPMAGASTAFLAAAIARQEGRPAEALASATSALLLAERDARPYHAARALLLLAELDGKDRAANRIRARALLKSCGAIREALLVPQDQS